MCFRVALLLDKNFLHIFLSISSYQNDEQQSEDLPVPTRAILSYLSIGRMLFALMLIAGASLNANAKEVTVKHHGLTLNANLSLAEGKKIKDGIILLTHGTLAHNRMELIATMQKLLAERGHSSLAINLGLGLDNRHGMYDCKVPHTHLHTDALDEIGLWLAWLKKQGAKKITLMGHSRGGGQTAWFAAERADPALANVVLLAPATWYESEANAGYEKSYGTKPGPLVEKAAKLVAAGKGTQMMNVPGFVYCKDAKASARAFVSYHASEPRRHTPANLPKIAVPVLVVAGQNDTVVKGLIDEVKKVADGKKIVLKIIDDADHFFLDFAAEDAADAISGFLKR